MTIISLLPEQATTFPVLPPVPFVLIALLRQASRKTDAPAVVATRFGTRLIAALVAVGHDSHFG